LRKLLAQERRLTHLKHESYRLKVVHSFMGATGLFPSNVDATNLNCHCVPAYRYVCWLTWVYHYALRGAFPLMFPYTYTRNLKVSTILGFFVRRAI